MKLWPYYVGWIFFEACTSFFYDSWIAWAVNASWTFCWFLFFIHSIKDKTAWFPPNAVIMVFAWEVALNLRYWTDDPTVRSYHNFHTNLWPVLTLLNFWTAWKFDRRRLGSLRKIIAEAAFFLALMIGTAFSTGTDHTTNWRMDAFLIPVLSILFLVDLVKHPRASRPPLMAHVLRIFAESLWQLFIASRTFPSGEYWVTVAAGITLLADAIFVVVMMARKNLAPDKA